jgi:hypothetical protein
MRSDFPITTELVAAYWLCQRKAFLLLQGDTGNLSHGYVKLIDAHASKSLSNFLAGLKTAGFKVQQSEGPEMIGHADVIARTTLKTDGLEAKGLPQNNISFSAVMSYASLYGQPKLGRLVPERVSPPQ